jgi:hypothetical protein
MGWSLRCSAQRNGERRQNPEFSKADRALEAAEVEKLNGIKTPVFRKTSAQLSALPKRKMERMCFRNPTWPNG